MENKRRILKVTQLREIQINGGFKFPISCNTRLILDKKKPVAKKEHQLIYQQGSQYGTVGDCCNYLTHEDLFELEKQRIIKIN